jgi:putative ABC transport system substrate-binding protein
MRRREFLGLVSGAAVLRPLPALAQQAPSPVVGFLNSASADGYASMAAAFKRGLKEAGYVEGQNVTIEHRWANNQYERLPALAADLVSREVAVIFANGPSIPAALTATKTIPIIFNSGDDPVRLGFVASLRRPGGNATGVAILSGELAAKRLELLRELVPHSKAIAVLNNSDFGPSGRFRADVEAAARALGLATSFLLASTATRSKELSIAWLRATPTPFWSAPALFGQPARPLGGTCCKDRNSGGI